MAGQRIALKDVRYFVQDDGNKNARPLLLLHGFSGSSDAWEDITDALLPNLRVLRVDILGHGQTDSPRDARRYEIERIASDVAHLLDALDVPQVALLGYSMGGRLALAFALKYPERVAALILESASPGLETEAEQMTRRKNDAALAEDILLRGIPWFVSMWENIPLFATKRNIPEEKRQAERNRRLAQNPKGLAASLKGMGTGSQPSYWPFLPQIIVPVCLLTGEFDQKFTSIAQRMNTSLLNAQAIVIENAGHTIHMEQPHAYILAVKQFLKGLDWLD